MELTNQPRLERRSTVKAILAGRTDEMLIVAGLGSAIWDVEVASENPLNFYLLGAMGSVVSTALGLATAQPNKQVVAFAGDSEIGMGLYALATVGWRSPKNLAIVCLDNGRFGETGGQISHTGQNLDLHAVAIGAGIPVAIKIDSETGIEELRQLIDRRDGPVFGHVLITADMPPVQMPIRNGKIGMARFREALLGHDALKE
ncbi:MAG: thiamine pyrophosphate-dependent enzyme [Hyphomicrobiaceae bacterium]